MKHRIYLMNVAHGCMVYARNMLSMAQILSQKRMEKKMAV